MDYTLKLFLSGPTFGQFYNVVISNVLHFFSQCQSPFVKLLSSNCYSIKLSNFFQHDFIIYSQTWVKLSNYSFFWLTFSFLFLKIKLKLHLQNRLCYKKAISRKAFSRKAYCKKAAKKNQHTVKKHSSKKHTA